MVALPAPAVQPRLRWSVEAIVPLVIFAAFAALPLAAAFGAKAYILALFGRIMIFAIAAIALDLLIGYGGLISFGHAAFVGLGAYAVGILSAHGISDALIALPVALIASALFGLATGTVCLRTRGVYFIMITLAFSQMVFFTASSLAPYGGDDGLTVQSRNTIAGFALMRDEQSFYYVVFRLPGRELSDLPRPDRFAFRPRVARRSRERGARGEPRLPCVSLSAGRLCDCRRLCRRVRVSAAPTRPSS